MIVVKKLLKFQSHTSQGTKNMSDFQQIFLNSGFAAVGVTSPQLPNSVTNRLRQWILDGHHGNMRYMERSIDSRADLTRIFADVKSVIVTLTPIKRIATHSPTIAAFAHNFTDYHLEIKNRLHLLLSDLQKVEPMIRGRAVVDSAPAFERALAVNAGLGWIGRNSMLIHPRFGSFTLIGLLLINKELPFNTNIVENLCIDGCTLCQDACPNGAIGNDCTIDARCCISYLTCEKSEPVAYPTHNHILGCDRCTEVCPHNNAVEIIEPSIEADWLSLSDEQFATSFRNTSFERVGLQKIKNLLKTEQVEVL